MKFIFIFILYVISSQQAYSKDSNGLILQDSTVRYEVNSSAHGSGFFIAPAHLSIEDVVSSDQLDKLITQTTPRPQFQKHERYWFYIKLKNQTTEPDWIAHVSHFFINKIKILAKNQSQRELFLFDKLTAHNEYKRYSNVLGRGFPINFNKGGNYLLLIELDAQNRGRPPYIALMSEQAYENWSGSMDMSYQISIGVIIGLVIIALICFVIFKDATFFWFGISSLCLVFLLLQRSHIAIFPFQLGSGLSIGFWALASFTNISLILFARFFMLVDTKKQKLIRFFDFYVIFSFGIYVLSLFLPNFINIFLLSLIGISTIGLIFFSACFKMLTQGRYYFIFLLGWIPVLFLIGENVFIIYSSPEFGESTLSYKNFREAFMQIGHMLIHMVAMFIRLLDLKKQKLQAQLESQAKSKFLASVSHDLRQPLHSMGMFLAHLNDHVTSSEGKQIFAKVHDLQISIDNSFKGLMDLTCLEAGAISVNMENVDIARIVQNLCLEYQPYARSKGIFLRVRANKNIVYTDPLLLERILRNLLSNALKYTEDGGVLVAIRARKEHFLIQIWDTGCGISTVEQDSIFNIYERSELIKNSHVGSGIGLATVKHLADFLEHKISVKSKENQGSMFELQINNISHSNKQIFGIEEVKTKSRFTALLDINNQEFYNEITHALQSWDYQCCKYEGDSTGVEANLIIMDLGISVELESLTLQLKNYELKYGSVAIAFFYDGEKLPIIKQLQKFNPHRLNKPFRAGQLRSLIRYLETSQNNQRVNK